MSIKVSQGSVQSHMGLSIEYTAKISRTYRVDGMVVLVTSETCAPIRDELLGAVVLSLSNVFFLHAHLQCV